VRRALISAAALAQSSFRTPILTFKNRWWGACFSRAACRFWWSKHSSHPEGNSKPHTAHAISTPPPPLAAPLAAPLAPLAAPVDVAVSGGRST
jgi:hypothetical protein